jgi:hypothetical protein
LFLFHGIEIEANLQSQDRANWLASKRCPEEVKWWNGRGKKLSVVPIIKVTEFAVEWKQWWDVLQPSWRVGRSEPPANADWKVLQRGGSNGIFIVLMCLSWWGNAVTSPEHREVFDAAVEDVVWVLQHVCMSIPASVGIKRAADNSDTNSANKRARQ